MEGSLQVRRPFQEILLRGADAPHAEGLTEGDGFFAMPWMATVGGEILMGVSGFDI